MLMGEMLLKLRVYVFRSFRITSFSRITVLSRGMRKLADIDTHRSDVLSPMKPFEKEDIRPKH